MNINLVFHEGIVYATAWDARSPAKFLIGVGEYIGGPDAVFEPSQHEIYPMHVVPRTTPGKPKIVPAIASSAEAIRHISINMQASS